MVEKREELFKAIQRHIAELKEIFDDIAEAKIRNDVEKVPKLYQRLDRKVAILNEYQEDKKMHAALARQIIRPFLKENNLI